MRFRINAILGSEPDQLRWSEADAEELLGLLKAYKHVLEIEQQNIAQLEASPRNSTWKCQPQGCMKSLFESTEEVLLSKEIEHKTRRTQKLKQDFEKGNSIMIKPFPSKN